MDGTPVAEATFRGRLLRGVAHTLPPGYQGALQSASFVRSFTLLLALTRAFRVAGVVLSREPNEGAWRAASGFGSFTAWNHDQQPSSADATPRLLHWLRLAAALAAPADAAAVTARMAADAAGAGAGAGAAAQ